jgi:hypothetical protein
MIQRRAVEFDLKALKKDGSFAGYGSVFNNTDLYNDVVMPGAFTDTLQAWAAKDRYPPVLWQHDSAQPIGAFTDMSEDSTGLYVEGKLLIKSVQRAAEAYALMDAKAINGMSIGFNIPDEDGCEYDAQNSIMKILKADLWEISIVTFPANQSATVTELKTIFAAGRTPTVREFEHLLRDIGCTKSRAAFLAGGLGQLLQREAESDRSKKGGETLLIDSALSAIRNFKI